MCETIDALGLAGFDKAFHSIEAIGQGQRAHMLDVSSHSQSKSSCHYHLSFIWRHLDLVQAHGSHNDGSHSNGAAHSWAVNASGTQTHHGWYVS